MAFYKPCPDCGANLDPGEVCECQWRSELLKKYFYERYAESGLEVVVSQPLRFKEKSDVDAWFAERGVK